MIPNLRCGAAIPPDPSGAVLLPIVVTGCAGFIGWRVCELLLAAGCPVVGLDNLNAAYDVRLKEWRLARLQGWPGFAFQRLDLADRAAVVRLGDGLAEPPAAVIHLAARAGVRGSVGDPWAYLESNIVGTLNLLDLCRRRGVDKFVLASSSSVYGQAASPPYREDQAINTPLSPYAASKVAAEALCHSYHHLSGLDVTVFRYFTVYGPAGRPDMLPFRLVQWISEGRPVTVYGDGSQRRDFTYVDDIARGTLAGLRRWGDAERGGYAVINLGCDRPVMLMDAIRLAEELIGRPAQLRFLPAHRADTLITQANISKAGELLGWQPQVLLRAGLGALVAWYRENRAWAADVVTTDA